MSRGQLLLLLMMHHASAYTTLYYEDHPGYDLSPSPPPATTVAACAAACSANDACVGFVFSPRVSPTTNRSCDPVATACQLKEWFSAGRDGDGCAQAALLRANPSVPPRSTTVYATISVDVSARASWPVSNSSMGCHFDAGYAHQQQLLYAQLLYGGAFETGAWPNVRRSPPAQAGQVTLQPPPVQALLGESASMGIHIEQNEASGAAMFVGAANRGLGNAGLLLEAGKEYVGYLLVSANASVSFSVRLEDYSVNGSGPDGSPMVLAEQQLHYGGGNWSRVNFTLTPTRSTTCQAIDPSAQGTSVAPCIHSVSPAHQRWSAHTCLRCGGQFSLGLTAAGEAHFGSIYLEPGPWGRLPGLPILRGPAERLQELGVSLIRVGGTFAIDDYWFWGNWRGRAEWRPPAMWRDSLMTGFGPFEVADMAEHLRMKFVYTTSAACNKGLCLACSCDTNPATPAAMAQLVEYSYGNASTQMGALRARDGHPEPYAALSHIELGNEQWNPFFTAQVAAMQAKALELGEGERLTYIYPHGQCGSRATNCSHASITHCGCPNSTEAAAASALQLGARLVLDAHPTGPKNEGGLGHDVPVFQADFANPIFNIDHGSRWGAAAFETNTGDYSLNDALFEAAELMRYFAMPPNVSSRVAGRAKSFCFERSGYNEGGANQQGMIFGLQNGTWLQPAAYVHKMLASSWLPMGIPVSSNSSSLQVSAQRALDGKRVVLRLLNHNDLQIQAQVALSSDEPSRSTRWEIENVTRLEPPIPGQTQAVNTAGEPTLVAPITSVVPEVTDGVFDLAVPPNSFVVVQLGLGS